MFFYIFTILLVNSVTSKPRYSDLDEDEQQLYRVAYESPSYDHDQYPDESEDGKLDLLKDGLWALKAELKQLKAFKKSLAFNMLTTKLQLKELLADTLVLKKHRHEVTKKEQVYNYQPPSYKEYGAHPHEHDPYHGY